MLRVALGVLLTGHGLQKATEWFHGPGLRNAAQLFEGWGFRPGRAMVLLAAACEVVAGILLVLGFGTPLATAIAVGTMIVAAAPNAANGLWAARGGVELPVAYALLSAVLASTGPGTFALDSVLPMPYPRWAGLIAILVGLAASGVPLLRRHVASVPSLIPRPSPRRRRNLHRSSR